jgi:hypothetical protein
MPKPKTWIVDIDGTLAIKGDRGPFDWQRVGEDTPNRVVILIIRALQAAGYEICYVSGRKEECRKLTLSWLNLHVSTTHTDDLFMRPDDDNRPDDILKQEIYEKYLKSRYHVLGVFDDRDKVVLMWREELGLSCLQVAPGNF